jgi:hypothetical protein
MKDGEIHLITGANNAFIQNYDFAVEEQPRL